jgi:hypothetical protein
MLITSVLINWKNGENKNAAIAELNFNAGKSSPETGIYDCKIIKSHPFSNPDKKDTFKLLYNCGNLADSMIFQIISCSGNKIYEIRFTGTSFYDYGRPWYDYITDPKRGRGFKPENLSTEVADSLHKADLRYIKTRMNNFFNEDRFIVNPILKFKKDKLNLTDYSGITEDSTVIGYAIQLTAEGFEMIAYSRKMQKVMFIASSD